MWMRWSWSFSAASGEVVRVGVVAQLQRACAINRREIPRLRKPTTSQERSWGKSVGLLRSEDVTKLQESDFFVSKLIVFSVTFGRKTKKSQPLGMTVFSFFHRQTPGPTD